MKKVYLASIILLSVVLAASIALANMTIPNTFTGGTPAVAAEVNDNFATIEEAMPGLASEYISGTMSTTSSFATANSVTISTPGAGYILLLTQGTVSHDHVTGTQSYAMVHVSTSPDTSNYDDQSSFGVPPEAPTATHLFSFAHQVVDTVPSAGDYTYYLNFGNSGAVGTETSIFRHKITAIFLPNAYGNVDDRF